MEIDEAYIKRMIALSISHYQKEVNDCRKIIYEKNQIIEEKNKENAKLREKISNLETRLHNSEVKRDNMRNLNAEMKLESFDDYIMYGYYKHCLENIDIDYSFYELDYDDKLPIKKKK